MSLIIEPIEDGHLLLRRVPKEWIRENDTIDELAYRPRRNKDTDGVSIGIERLIREEISLLTFANNNPKKWKVYRLLARVPRACGYECIHNHKAHGLIIGDMEKLYNDDDTLRILAKESERHFPIEPPATTAIIASTTPV